MIRSYTPARGAAGKFMESLRRSPCSRPFILGEGSTRRGSRYVAERSSGCGKRESETDRDREIDG